MLQFSETTVI